MTFHSKQTANHKLESDVMIYADAAARTGATGLTAADDGKIAYQTDTGEYYRLTDYSGPTWAQIVIGSLNVGTPASGNALVYNGSNWVAGNVSAGQADSLIESFQNETGGTLSQLEAVYISGFDIPSGLATIAKADASNVATMPSIGIVENDITTGNSGNVIISGLLGGVDTSSFSPNDILYVSATTPGQLTATRPTGAADKVQELAEVIRSHATQGIIQVFGSGSAALLSNLPQNTAWVGDANNAPTSTSVVLADGSIAGATGAAQDFGANGVKADAIAESTAAAGVTADGVLLKDSDIINGSTGHGLFSRFINLGVTPDDHFRSGTIPSGYTWASDGTFNGTPTLEYSHKSDWLKVTTAGGPYFLQKNVSVISSNSSAEIMVLPNNVGGIGWRVDDGTNTNYYQCIVSASAGEITITLEQSAGATVTYGPFFTPYPLYVRFYSLVSGANHRGAVYLGTPLGDYGSLLLGTYEAISNWAASGWRSGIVTNSGGGFAWVDWFDERRT